MCSKSKTETSAHAEKSGGLVGGGCVELGTGLSPGAWKGRSPEKSAVA